MRSLISICIAALIVAYLVLKQNREQPPIDIDDSFTEQTETPVAKPKVTKPKPAAPAAAPQPVIPTKSAPQVKAAAADPNSDRVMHFVIEDGVAVVQGDMVVGEIAGAPPQGNVLLPKVYPWQRSEIAFGISPDLPRPERVQQAIEMFAETAVKLVPYNGEEDAIVFIPGTGNCKSYVGKVRGKQPIWIAPDCEANDVAHEIMHALGFVHEQNRTDRDSYIEVVEENIKDEFKFNFDKLPSDFMQLTGLSEFAFDSIMIYSEMAFSKNGQATIKSKNENNKIAPKPTLSSKDIERINREYSRK